MAKFEVPVVPITVEPHPNADRIEIAVFAGYRSVVRKGQFRDGDLVAYIPEGAVVPEALLREIDLWDDAAAKGRLAGPAGTRVKIMRFRGQTSQGLCYPARAGWSGGQDVTAELGITKYIPPIPACMSGRVVAVGLDHTVRFDVESWQRYPDALREGELVVLTEKIHGTQCCVGVFPDGDATPAAVASKGLAARGLAFDMSASENAQNLYLRAVQQHRVVEKVRDGFASTLARSAYEGYVGEPVFVLGEVFGAGVQKGFDYGARAATDETLGFRVFAVYIGWPQHGRFVHAGGLSTLCQRLDLGVVPEVWRGPFSIEEVRRHADGQEGVSGEGRHIREGVVIVPAVERRDDASGLGRVCLKLVSEEYLHGTDGTEVD